jgi:DNA-binding response OmpR family regulator
VDLSQVSVGAHFAFGVDVVRTAFPWNHSSHASLPPPPPAGLPHNPVTEHRARPRVLIVDDDASTRELYSWCMAAAGWLVETASNGVEALHIAPVFEPDVIVMDLTLPVLDGLEAIRRLRREDDTRHVPIVALTGRDRSTAELAARVAGCDEFVVKPCDPELFRELLEAILRRRRDPGSVC